MFDNILVSLVHEEGMERFLACPTCLINGKERFFSAVGPGFEPHDQMELCQSLSLIDEHQGDDCIQEQHGVDEKQRSLVGSCKQEQASTLHEFLKDGIEAIKKTSFRELEGDLVVGDQIWIYRDGRRNPCNPVAVIMPYAHVAVFVGEENGQKKVVHVEKASCLNGLLTATIKKVNLNRVIKPDDRGKASFTLNVCLPFSS